ncbi:NHP2 protein, partial [Oxylabes madagascariensis]|nr:NHP2 protein [Oxylabes madagascariensis]
MAREKPEAAAEAEAAPELSYREQLEFLNPIAQPLASRKLTRKLLKCIRKATRHKQIRRGVKEVQKFINKGEKGITVLAGDTLPIDVYCHIPIMCEDRSLPYAYVPSKT